MEYEWRLHNYAHAVQIQQERSAHVDLNNLDEGKGLWDFIGDIVN